MTTDDQIAAAYDDVEMALGALQVVSDVLYKAAVVLDAAAFEMFEVSDSQRRVAQRLVDDSSENAELAIQVRTFIENYTI